MYRDAFASAYISFASASCRAFDAHSTRRAEARARPSEGSRIPINTEITATTTKSSIKVNAPLSPAPWEGRRAGRFSLLC